MDSLRQLRERLAAERAGADRRERELSRAVAHASAAERLQDQAGGVRIEVQGRAVDLHVAGANGGTPLHRVEDEGLADQVRALVKGWLEAEARRVGGGA